MDKEEKYWSKLEKIYVHNVYENISSRYDEFLKISKLRYYTSRDFDDSDDVNNNNASVLDNHQPKTHPLANGLLNPSVKTTNYNSDESNLIISKFHATSSSPNLKLKKRLNLKNLNNTTTTKQKHNAWPKVEKFIRQLDPYSLVADVGCGDGKYLNLNSHILSIGSDRSSSLCKLASVKYPPTNSVINQNQLVICDNLTLPFRSNLFDAVISIGVIHHMSTEKRRTKAIQELARILKPGGKIMIYVWAMEQRLRKFNTQDVLVPMLDTKVNLNLREVKFRLRRDLSNNSTAESEDSNEELSFERTHLLNSKTNDLEAPSNEPENFKDSSASQKQEVEFNLDSNETLHDDDHNDTFVENFKRFFSKKLFSNASSKSKKLVSSPTSPSTCHMTSNGNSTMSSPSICTQSCVNEQNASNEHSGSLKNVHSIEKYKQIIETYKELLPKNFTIRKFPGSSCQDTFDANNPKNNNNNNNNNMDSKSTDDEKTTNSSTKASNSPSTDRYLETHSTSSASLTPSPINQYSPVAHLDSRAELASQTSSPSATGNQNGEMCLDESNQTNKRFYHVFRKNELDSLVKVYCPSLSIYDSYYDHGNWCICAFKQ